MYKRPRSYCEKNGIFFSSQYGFRDNCSTQHAILDILNKIQSKIDAKLFSCGIFIDLKKPLGTVDHSILLHKLNHYGVRGIINTWFSSYLSKSSQLTQIGSTVSNKEAIVCGVLQGSVLGPILFLIYVNDIYRCSQIFDFYLFPDDFKLLYSDKDLKRECPLRPIGTRHMTKNRISLYFVHTLIEKDHLGDRSPEKDCC